MEISWEVLLLALSAVLHVVQAWLGRRPASESGATVRQMDADTVRVQFETIQSMTKNYAECAKLLASQEILIGDLRAEIKELQRDVERLVEHLANSEAVNIMAEQGIL